MFCHAQTAYGPPKRTKHLPKSYRLGVHGYAANRFVTREEISGFAESAHRQMISTKTPRVGQHPPQIAHRITDVGHFPIQHRNNTVSVDHHVAVTKVVVHQGRANVLRQVIQQPTRGVVDHWLRRVEILIALPGLAHIIFGCELL